MNCASTARRLLLFLSIASAVACAQQVDSFTVVHTYPHDAQAFTQGLIYLDGLLYESTGLVGKSSLREEDAETGAFWRSTTSRLRILPKD